MIHVIATARAITLTFTPCVFISSEVQDSIVDPVVITSSTSSMCLFSIAALLPVLNMPSTLIHLS